MSQEARLHTIEEINFLKYDKLVDILRRVVANPNNIKEVAERIALDWNPVVRIESDGKITIVVGHKSNGN